jgi:type IV pilus biogenesis protein CpaD/CtpE
VAFSPREWLRAVAAIDRLLGQEAKFTTLIEAQAKEIQALKDRVTKLEARQEILIAEAKGTAASAASVVASQHVAELARHIGAMDERIRRLHKLTPHGSDNDSG